MTPFTITEEKAGAFRVTSARKDDEEEVMDLLVQAAEWLRDKGSNQWSGLLQGEDTHNMREAIAKGYVFYSGRMKSWPASSCCFPKQAGGTDVYGAMKGMRSPYISTGWRLTGGLQGRGSAGRS